MRWIDRALLAGLAAAIVAGAALYASAAQPAAAVHAAQADSEGPAGLDRRIAGIVERCVIEGAGTHLAFIRCEIRN